MGLLLAIAPASSPYRRCVTIEPSAADYL